MVNLDQVSRESLVQFVRACAPDVVIRKARLPDGRRACGARFTFRGEEIIVEAIESDEVKDPDDAIVRRCAWVLRRRLGMPVTSPGTYRHLELAVLEAAQKGDTATVERLGLELAMSNEAIPLRPIMRARWTR